MSTSDEATRMRGFSLVELMRRAWPKHAAKRAAQAARVSHRTAEKWVSGERTPPADKLLMMMSECERLRGEVLRALGGADVGNAETVGRAVRVAPRQVVDAPRRMAACPSPAGVTP